MKLKKVMALTLAGVMTLSAVGCGSTGSETADSAAAKTETKAEATTEVKGEETPAAAPEVTTPTGLEGKLTIWTLAEDLNAFADHFQEANPNVEIETVVIAPADYPTKVETALLGGDSSVDIIVGEPQMLESMYEAEFFANLDEFGAKDYEGKIVDYVWEVGQDAEGIQRAISYQVTPAGFYYRRDIAKNVFGTDDPVEIGKYFTDYPTIIETGKTLKEAGYRIFASDAETQYFSGNSAWVIDDKLNIDQSRYDYMDMCIELYKQDLTAYAAQWTAPWYQAMSGPVPILNADVMWGDWADEDGDGQAALNVWDAENFNANVANYSDETAEVFAYGLPSWGTLTMRDNGQDQSGIWGICEGPAYGFGGGTFIGISNLSENKDLAWEFVKFVTLNEETAEWWIKESNGDVVSLISAVEKHANDENPVYGGQKTYAFWLEQAKGIDYSKVTMYDKAIGDAWGNAITAVKTGQKNKEEALAEFYDLVESTYPELTIER